MIPVWKLRRELGRLRQQLQAIPGAVMDPRAQARLDALVAQGLPMMQGRVPLGQKVAIYLLWQPRGIAASVLRTCRWMADSGYAPLIVSNAPLTEADRAALAPVVWRAVERPNFGYDFGGYRDGLTCLRQWGVKPARLVILNDSIWVPLQDGDTLLARLEGLPADIAGSILRERGEALFLESYLYSIRGPVLDHLAFRAFWDTLRLTSNKYLVIRRGERGFSQAMRDAGLTLAALYPLRDFLTALDAAGEGDLREVLRHAAHPDDAVQADLRALAKSSSPDFSAVARDRIMSVLKRAQFYSTFPVGAVRWLDYPIMKKSADPVIRRWRSAYLAAVEDGLLTHPSETVQREMTG